MNTRNTLTAIASAIVLITASGCAVTRGQESAAPTSTTAPSPPR